jgi:transcriptional regulator with XRE-family HTH domain
MPSLSPPPRVRSTRASVNDVSGHSVKDVIGLNSPIGKGGGFGSRCGKLWGKSTGRPTIEAEHYILTAQSYHTSVIILVSFSNPVNARYFKHARKQAGWSQQKAAAELGVSQSYLSMLENGERPLPPEVARRMVYVYRLSPVSLPPSQNRWDPRAVEPEQLAAELAGLGYPGFAYLRKRRSEKHPGEVLLTALAQEELEARLFEALPWLVLKYWDMDTSWLVEQAKLHDLQNRLGFVVSLAKKAGRRAAPANPRRDAALEELESSLKRSLLAREEPLGQPKLSEAEHKWLKKHRPEEAREWNLLTNWRPEALRYVA